MFVVNTSRKRGVSERRRVLHLAACRVGNGRYAVPIDAAEVLRLADDNGRAVACKLCNPLELASYVADST
ncbi:DUF6233 domain-containing protein [Actinophytocola sp.]|uniref:DUF6233 domain-containing protein n=1 Tax=Actinophytocola sp. TaxID=1872138 RepID=UPI002D805DB1|nr:hypothetical protein [Actinophytocola sp.]HET9144072.1 hypothetical protein [Actinophytocola sp.]